MADSGPLEAGVLDAGVLAGCARVAAIAETNGFVERNPAEFSFSHTVSQPPFDRWWHYVSPLEERGCVSYRAELAILGKTDALGNLNNEGHYLLHACHECTEDRTISWRSGAFAPSLAKDPRGEADLFVQANENGLLLSIALVAPDDAHHRPVGCPVPS